MPSRPWPCALMPFVVTAVIAVPVAQDRPAGRVLVMPFAVDAHADAPGAAGAALWLGEAAAVLLTDGLTARGLSALARSERLAAFDQLDLPMSSALTRATMIRVGELVGASAVVFGDVQLDGRLTVRARLIDLGAGAEAPAVRESAEIADLFALFGRISDRLAAARGRPNVAVPDEQPPLPVEAFENYVKGLVAATPEAQQRFLEAAMVQAPGDGRVLVELWRVYGTLGLHDKALEVASGVPAPSPLIRPARFAVALTLIELGRLEGAFRELQTLHDSRPSAAAANALGVVELRRGGASGAGSSVRYFEEAVRLEPADTDYRFNLGYGQARSGNRAAALATLREAARLDATDAEAHVLMSVLLTADGRPAEARRERELAVWLGALADAATPVPAVPEGLERLSPSLDLDTGLHAARLGGQPGQRDERVTSAYHLGRGRELVEARRDRDAIVELKRAIYLDPYADEPHLLLGVVYQRGGRLAEAIDEFRVALWARETADGQVALGRALFDAGDREAAKRAARRALELDPQSLDARELLDRIGG